MKKGVDYIGVGVGAMILNNRGEVFLGKRGIKSRNERGFWEIPGGGVEFGEKLINAIKREVKEEHGITITIIKQLPAINHIIPRDKQHWVTTCFIAKVKGKKMPQILEPAKCSEVGWFSFNKLPSPLSIAFKLNLISYKKYR